MKPSAPATPGPQGRTGVYKIFGPYNISLYVGLSYRPKVRCDQYKSSYWWHLVSRIDVDWYETRRDAEFAEVDAIQGLRPVLNRRFAMPHRAGETIRYPSERVLIPGREGFTPGRSSYRITLPVVADPRSFQDGVGCSGFLDYATAIAIARRSGIRLDYNTINHEILFDRVGGEGVGWISMYRQATHVSAKWLRKYMDEQRVLPTSALAQK
ncbi:hypothetical protein ACWKSP_22425 [Micromonosporaceae bacterium Da 78-11]